MSILISDLPEELIEQIITNLDGVSVAKVSSVCKIWSSVYRNLIKRNFYEFWCRKDISPSSLLEVIDRLYPKYPVKKQGRVDWFRVYKCWYWWTNISAWVPSVNAFFEDYRSKINCMKVSGDWVVFGTVNEGEIRAYNLRQHCVVYVYRGHGVIDITLINFPNEPLNGNTNRHDGIHFHLRNNSIMSLTFGDKVHLHKDATVDPPTDQHPSVVSLNWLLYVKCNFNSKMVSLGLSEKTMEECLASICNRYDTFINIPCSISSHPSSYQQRCLSDISHWFQLRRDVAFGISFTEPHIIVFMVGERIKLYKPCECMFTIRCGFIHCNTLFLGNNFGTLYAYRLETEESLLALNLFDHSWMFHVANSPICSIDVQYTDNEPFLVVATDSTIFKVSKEF